MDVSGGAASRRIHIRMGIDPNQSNLLILSPIKRRSSGDTPRGQGVIAPQDKRKSLFLQTFHDPTCHPLADFSDLLEKHLSLLTANGIFGDLDLNISPIFYRDVGGLQLLL